MLRSASAALLLLATGCGSACAPKASLRGLSIESDLEAGRAAGAARFDHSAWGRVLAAAAAPERGRFDYDAVPRADLDAYLLQLEQAPLATLPGDEQRALLINAYNAFTVQLIVSQPVRPASIRDLPAPWKTAQWTLGGHALSLDDIEHGLLRPVFRDPRVHFAVNCASVGCPPLRGAPFEAAALDAQLDAATRAALAHPTWLTVEDGALHVTRLLDWYGADFTAEGWSPRAASRAAWLARFGPPEVAAAVQAADGDPELVFLDYDWTLNDLP